MKRSNLLYWVIPVIGTFLIAQADLLIGNISGLTVNPYFYVIVLGFYLLMGWTFAQTIKKVTNSRLGLWGMAAIVLAVVIPYSFNSTLIANLHVLNAYLGFAIFSFVLYKTLNNFKIYDYRLAKRLINLTLIMYLIILLMALHFMVINGLMEIIYLWIVDIVLGIIELKVN